MKLRVEDLSKSYGSKEVLKNISFTFENGKIYGLLGRNGVGKTTFFNCLNSDITVDKGNFYLVDDSENTELKTSDIGYVVSTPIVPEFLTAREFLQFFVDINEEKITEKKSIDEYFDIVKIDKSDRDKLLRDYSHGMKNKMQILINIIAKPSVILLDEPLTSLDIVVQDEMKKLFRLLKKDHIIILSTHILELAMDLCDEIIILNNKTLELIEKKDLDTKEYKDKIINSLKEQKDV